MTFLDARRDELIAFARVLLMALFLIFGWSKLAHFGAAVQSMAAVGAPLPALFATFAVIIELSVGVARGRLPNPRVQSGDVCLHGLHRTDRPSLLDHDWAAVPREHGAFLQEPEHSRRLAVAVRDRTGSHICRRQAGL
jgi:hypothetical protein